jgi:hypothetical protein
MPEIASLALNQRKFIEDKGLGDIAVTPDITGLAGISAIALS